MTDYLQGVLSCVLPQTVVLCGAETVCGPWHGQDHRLHAEGWGSGPRRCQTWCWRFAMPWKNLHSYRKITIKGFIKGTYTLD